MLFVGERRRSKRRQSAIRARDVRAADLQEKPAKPSRTEEILQREPFRRTRRRRRLPANIAASGASHQTERAWRGKQYKRARQSNAIASPACLLLYGGA